MLEFTAVSLAGALCAIGLPRVLLPSTTVARRARHGVVSANVHPAPANFARTESADTVGHPPDTGTTPELIVDPAQNGTTDTPLQEQPDAARPDVEAPPRVRTTSRTLSDGTRVSRHANRWKVDLARDTTARSLVSGVHLRLSARDGGASDGYTITSLDRDGLCSLAGVRVGDVIEAVNGLPVRNPDEALEVLSVNRRATSFNVRVRRGARRYTLGIDLHGGRQGPLI